MAQGNTLTQSPQKVWICSTKAVVHHTPQALCKTHISRPRTVLLMRLDNIDFNQQRAEQKWVPSSDEETHLNCGALLYNQLLVNTQGITFMLIGTCNSDLSVCGCTSVCVGVSVGNKLLFQLTSKCVQYSHHWYGTCVISVNVWMVQHKRILNRSGLRESAAFYRKCVIHLIPSESSHGGHSNPCYPRTCSMPRQSIESAAVWTIEWVNIVNGWPKGLQHR